MPIICLSHIAFKVSDLGKARAYYDGVLGFHEAFTLKDSSDRITSAFFKINDDQYIEVMPMLAEGEVRRVDHVAILAEDLENLRRIYEQRGVNPGRIGKTPDGNLSFRVVDPEGTKVDFVQYTSDSLQAQARGTCFDERRISTKISHFGMALTNREATVAFYTDKIGLGEGSGGSSPAGWLPGSSGEYLELMNLAVDLETKEPPIDPAVPETHDQYLREQFGSMQHICLEVPDISRAANLAKLRGGFDDKRVAPHIGRNRHWLLNIFDPDGSRTEFMEPTTQS